MPGYRADLRLNLTAKSLREARGAVSGLIELAEERGFSLEFDATALSVEGNFTLVEDPDQGSNGLAVRPVTDAEKSMVSRWGGYLFETVADAEEFARAQLIFSDGPPIVRQAFAHKRVDGLRIYVHQSSAV